jgi:hypothetical protein
LEPNLAVLAVLVVLEVLAALLLVCCRTKEQ